MFTGASVWSGMNQTGPVKVPVPPAPPIPPGAVGSQGAAPLVITPGMLSSQDVAVFRARGRELSNQLNSAGDRRRNLQQSLRQATGADRSGLEQRLGVLDARIARLEGDIDENGKALASLPAQRASTLQQDAPPPPFQQRTRIERNMVPIAIVFTIFVLSPIAMSVSRFLWRRGNLPRQASANPENAERLQRMEQAIDSIAIEVERVSEGQRFVTRLLAEGRPVPGALGQPVPERVAVPVGERAAVPR